MSQTAATLGLDDDLQPRLLTASLVPETPAARAALGDAERLEITRLPFNVGRESRWSSYDKLRDTLERRLGGATPQNDVYLLEPPSDRLHVSREHFAIDIRNGHYMLFDRDSAGGVIVSGKYVGRGAARWATLQHGDTIVVGTDQSPYRFRFECR